VSPRRALLQHLWAMVQTRAEAAGLVLELQRTALTQSLLFGAIAAVTGLSFLTAVIVWIAVAAPAAWRGTALALVALALLATAVYGALGAGRRLRQDASLIADFSRSLKLDLAMINLVLTDPPPQDEGAEKSVPGTEKPVPGIAEAAVLADDEDTGPRLRHGSA